MNVDGLYGSVYSPSDGTIDPAGYCSALARGARKRGGKVTINFGIFTGMCFQECVFVYKIEYLL